MIPLRLLAASSAMLMILAGTTAFAAPVGFEGRLFQGTGGRGSAGPGPCCNAASGSIDTRTTGFATSMTASGTALIPAGNAYFGEIGWNQDNAFSQTHNQFIVGDVTAAGAVTVPAGAFKHNNIATLPNPPGWVYFIQSIDNTWAQGNFGPGAGPPAYTYLAAANPYTTMKPVTNMTGGGGTTTGTSTVNWILNGEVKSTPGANNFGGTMGLLGGNAVFLGINGVGTVREIEQNFNYAGAILPNQPALGANITRAPGDTFIRIHLGSINGPIVVSLAGVNLIDSPPFTTGTVMAANSSIFTPAQGQGVTYAVRTDMGQDLRTTTSYLNGNLQLVQPLMMNSFTTGSPTGGTPTPISRKWQFEFVPEPTSLSLIGVGVVGLFGLAGVQRRRR